MSDERRHLGALGERLAVEYLREHGYVILETNFRCREGEIDVVARHKDYLVFVEVRTRRRAGPITPEESITAAKKRKLLEVASVYLQGCDEPPLWRIDVVAVELTPKNRVSRVELIENAIN